MRSPNDIAPSALAAVDEMFATFHGTEKAPGLAYAVVANGEIVHAAAVGAADLSGTALDADSVLRIASMTKSFTAAIALLLRDEGVLRLDDPVAAYVPELAALRLPTADSPAPTIRMLLTMSGGLPTDDPWADREESMSVDGLSALLASGLTFSAAPGTGFQYSNLGYVIVGRAIANVTGVPYRDVVRTRLLEPLGLRSTGFSVDDVAPAHVVGGYHRLGEEWMPEPFAAPGEFSPLGGLFSSVRDLATWVGGFTDAFPPRDDPESSHPLSRATRREMQQLQRFNDVTVPAQREDSPAPPVRARVIGYGLGLTVVHDTRWGHIAGHSGGYPGYGSHMRWHTTTGVGVIALGNGRYTPASTPAAAALEIVLASVAAPSRRISRWSRTRELQRAAHQLVVRWDDSIADQIFAANVDLDLARDARRADVLGVTEQLGTISPDADPTPTSATAAEIDWWITGEHGRARVELMLTPHGEPLVQEMSVSFVGDVSSALLHAADNVAKDLQRPGDAAAAEIECVEWQDSNSATFRIRLGVDEWRASITVDAQTGDVSKTTITPTPPSAYRFDVAADEQPAKP